MAERRAGCSQGLGAHGQFLCLRYKWGTTAKEGKEIRSPFISSFIPVLPS